MAGDIINTHDQLIKAGGGVAITKSVGGIRQSYIDGWQVYRIVDGLEVKTNPDGAWYHYGRKWFDNHNDAGSFHARQRVALEAAQQWIAEQGWYDGEWARNRDGDYVPVNVNKQFPIRKRA